MLESAVALASMQARTCCIRSAWITMERSFCARSSLAAGSQPGLIGIEVGMATHCEARELQGIEHKSHGSYRIFVRVRSPKPFQSGE